LFSSGQGANEQEGATRPTHDPSGQHLTSMAHLTFSGFGGFLNHNNGEEEKALLINVGN